MATASNIEKLDDAYDAEMVKFFDRLESMKEAMYANFAAPDEYAASEGFVNWGHVGDLKRINEMLTEAQDVIENANE